MEFIYFCAAGLIAGLFGYTAIKNKYTAIFLAALWPVAHIFGHTLAEALVSALLSNLLLVIAVIDLESFIIPNQLVISILLLSLPEFVLRIEPVWYDRLIGAASAGSLCAIILILGGEIYGQSVFGWGDIKLITVSGLLLGLRPALLSLFIAAVFMAIAMAALKAIRKLPERGAPVPFAPALAVGVMICRYWGTGLLELIMPG